MKSQTLAVAVVGVVSGALGSAMVAGFAGKAFAAQPQPAGKPQIVQVVPAPGSNQQLVGGGPASLMVGTLFRVWSDGMVDAVAYTVKPPLGQGNPQSDYWWNYVCTATQTVPPSLCVEPLGFIPSDLSSIADLNRDGVVNGADMGLLLGEWDQSAASER